MTPVAARPVDYPIIFPVCFIAGSWWNSLAGLRREVLDCNSTMRGEISCVDDGSGDDSWPVLQQLQSEQPDVLRFIRMRQYRSSTGSAQPLEAAHA